MQTFLKLFSKTTLFVKNGGYKTENVYHFFSLNVHVMMLKDNLFLNKYLKIVV